MQQLKISKMWKGHEENWTKMGVFEMYEWGIRNIVCEIGQSAGRRAKFEMAEDALDYI